MNFDKFYLWPYITASFVILCFLIYRIEKKFFAWIKDHWFYHRTFASKLSTGLFLGAILLLLISLLDLRGPEIKVEAEILDQKTILLIDSSASMLAEDVRPNRFKKAIQLARHFVRKSAGHQIAIALFSDIQKRIVPFTDDIDLLDSRLTALEDVDISSGGSNLTQAVRESLQYFKSEGTKDGGNLIIFTDAEGHDGELEAEFSDKMNIAVVALGTISGGKIPIRDNRGNFRGYKKHNGEEVVTKINEEYLKSLLTKIDNFKYWIVQSYNLPTEEILDFLRAQYEGRLEKGSASTKPVLGHYLVSVAVLLFVLSSLFKIGKTFTLPTLLVLMFLCEPPLPAQEEKLHDEKLMLELLNRYQQADLEKEGRLKLAELLSKNKKDKQALSIYDDTIKNFQNERTEDLFNYATTLLKTGKIDESLAIFDHVKRRIDKSEGQKNLKEDINKNILLALKEKKKKQQEEKNKSKKDDQKDGKEGKEKQQSQNDQQSKSNEEKQDKDKKEQGQKKEEEKEGDKKDKQDKKKSLKEREEEIKKKRKMKKIPAMLKQIMSDDRQLQKKYIDTSTDKSQTMEKKAW